MAAKLKRKAYSIDFKLKLLAEVDKGRKKQDICRKFGIPKSSLSTILKDRSKLDLDLAPTRKRAQLLKHSDVDEAVLI